jgi:LPS export ABC transporter permease LptG
VLLTGPRHVYELLPMTALVGALVGLGMLAAGNELVALQAAGVTKLRIVGAVLQPTLLVILAGLALGELVAPPLEIRAEVGKALASGEQVGLSRYGHWERDGSAFMHFNAIEPDGVLYGVDIFVFDERQRMVRTINAESAVYDAGNWVLMNGTELAFTHGSDGVTGARSDFASQSWDLGATHSASSARAWMPTPTTSRSGKNCCNRRRRSYSCWWRSRSSSVRCGRRRWAFAYSRPSASAWRSRSCRTWCTR